MKSMKRISCLVGLFVGVLMAGLQLSSSSSPSLLAQRAKTQLRMGDSTEDVKKSVMRFLPANFKVVGGAPKFVVLQAVTADDADKMGLLSAPALGSPPPPLTLVILEGRFEVTQWIGGVSGISKPSERSEQTPESAKYVLYVIDRCVGLPTATAYSSNPKFVELLFTREKSSRTRKRTPRPLKRTTRITPSSQLSRRVNCPKEIIPPSVQPPTSVPPEEPKTR
jgi:hypothetical protein